MNRSRHREEYYGFEKKTVDINETDVVTLQGQVTTHSYIIESVDSISRDERDVPLTQYITNA